MRRRRTPVIARNIPRSTHQVSEQMVISVATASRWLEGNVHNRDLRPATVTRYARDMEAGRWGDHHQGLLFSRPGITIGGTFFEDPVLFDGQHRLCAIVKSGCPQTMLVTYGAPASAQQFIDDHERRSTTDVYSLEHRDRSASRLTAAMAKEIWRRGRAAKHLTKLTRQEELALIDDHWDAIMWVSNHVSGRRVRYILTAPVLAQCARAWYHENRTELARFIDELITGAIASPSSPVLQLRNQLLARASGNGRRGGIAMGQAEQSERTAIALKAFLDGRQLLRLVHTNPPRFKAPGDEERAA